MSATVEIFLIWTNVTLTNVAWTNVNVTVILVFSLSLDQAEQFLEIVLGPQPLFVYKLSHSHTLELTQCGGRAMVKKISSVRNLAMDFFSCNEELKK